MTTTGCCDIIRNAGDNRPNDREPFVLNVNLTSSSIEYPKPLASGASGSSNLSHRNRGHKRTKSAGNNSLRESSLYTATGLYAHHNRSRTHVRHHSSSNIPIKTYSDLNIYDLIASNRLRSVVEINSGSLIIDQQNALQTEEQITNCGFLSFRPKCLQRLATIQAFVFFCCVLVTLQQALSSGYFNSVITTIEKRFDFPSSVTGAIVSTFELGNLLTIIFVSYFGTHRHIPQWIGKGIVITGIGSIVFAIPHFMDIHNPLDNVNVSGPVSDNMCRIPTPALSSPVLENVASHFIHPVTPITDETCEEGGTYNAPHILIFILAMILIGCGGTPIFTLGTTYIDDHVRKESSSMYIGCMYSMVAFGLVCGFLLGGYFIQVHENSFGSGYVPLDISPGHPKWIGAWWAGFIMLGILLILISIPFFAFPKSLKPKTRSEKQLRSSQSTEVMDQIHKTKYGVESARNTLSSNRAQSPHHKHHEYGKNIKEIPSCMWRLLTNPVYMTTCLGSCMELAIVSGFLVFLPKYLETQFSLGKSEANLFAGGIAVPGACVGIFLGGYLLKRFQMKPKGAIQFVLFFNLVCMGLYTALYFLGCDNVRMAGTTLPYANNSRFEAFQVNLTADCNLGCRCSPNEIEPVCDTQNKISYYSPCFAGCRSAESHRNPQNYSNCACLTAALNNKYSNEEVTAIPLATAGPCPQVCQAMIPFMILLFVITLVVSITQMPLLMITLRSVEEEERSLALGMQFVIFRLFGYIPSPIIFGNVIDSTCIVWKAHCGQQGGFCLLYNIEQFRLRYVGVCSGLKVAAGLLFFLDWLLICYRHKKESNKPPVLTMGEIVSSIISLDRLSVFGWNTEIREDDEEQPLGPDSGIDTLPKRKRSLSLSLFEDYNSANGMDEQDLNERDQEFTFLTNKESYGMSRV